MFAGCVPKVALHKCVNAEARLCEVRNCECAHRHSCRSSAGTPLWHQVTSGTLLFIGSPSTLTHSAKRKRRVSVCIFHALDKQLSPVGVIAAELEAPGGHSLLLTCRYERTRWKQQRRGDTHSVSSNTLLQRVGCFNVCCLSDGRKCLVRVHIDKRKRAHTHTRTRCKVSSN